MHSQRSITGLLARFCAFLLDFARRFGKRMPKALRTELTDGFVYAN